jgi:hypothetical protein
MDTFGRRGAAVAAALALTACGARSDLAPDSDGATTCTAAPRCGDDTRGTWQLETAGHALVGYLYMFDGIGACNSTSDNFLLELLPASGECDRNGAYAIQVDTATSFQFSTDNLGGSDDPGCGDDPNTESMQLDLSRSPCADTTYELVVHDSAPGSPYDVTAVATRCRCDVGWVPCVGPLPSDPCGPS